MCHDIWFETVLIVRSGQLITLGFRELDSELGIASLTKSKLRNDVVKPPYESSVPCSQVVGHHKAVDIMINVVGKPLRNVHGVGSVIRVCKMPCRAKWV